VPTSQSTPDSTPSALNFHGGCASVDSAAKVETERSDASRTVLIGWCMEMVIPAPLQWVNKVMTAGVLAAGATCVRCHRASITGLVTPSGSVVFDLGCAGCAKKSPSFDGTDVAPVGTI